MVGADQDYHCACRHKNGGFETLTGAVNTRMLKGCCVKRAGVTMFIRSNEAEDSRPYCSSSDN